MTTVKLWLLAASVIATTINASWAQQVDLGRSDFDIDIGKANFEMSCASCHGADAKGNGPVSSQLKAPPADLTVLARKNNGVFPVSSVYEVIDGRQPVLAHGSREMPVWGLRYQPSLLERPMQSYESFILDPEAIARARILSIVDYLNRIQEK